MPSLSIRSSLSSTRAAACSALPSSAEPASPPAVVKNGKGKKVRVYKMKPKKGYQRTQGHRQPYTKVQINTINA